MEEVEDYLSDIFEDAFDSLEDDLSRDLLLREIQQPSSSLRIPTVATGSSSHHEQRLQDYIIDIIGGGGGGEEGGGGGEEDEDEGGEEVDGSGEEVGNGGEGGDEEGGGEEDEDEGGEEVDGSGEEVGNGGEEDGEEEVAQVEEEESGGEEEEEFEGRHEEEVGGGESYGEEEDEDGERGGEEEEEEEERRESVGGEIQGRSGVEEDEGLGGGGRGGGERQGGGRRGGRGQGGGGGRRGSGGGNEDGHGYNNTGGRRHLLISETKCIFKVPKHIRGTDQIAYTPQWVSIGPYHYGNPKLSYMESHKKSFLASTKWDPEPDRQSSLRTAMLEFEVMARRCYSKKFNNIDSRTFVEIMLTDAFFIIHLFLAYDIWCKDDGELPDHPLFKTRWRLPNLCQDLLMLENQLPFFILVQVFAILTNESANSLKKLAIQFFRQVRFGKVAEMANSSRFAPPENPKHLLDLFHSSFVGERRTSSSSSHRMETKYWVNNSSALSDKAVRFIGIQGNPLDIEFSQLGTLRIPTFCINDRTITVLKNLLAYEQGSPLANPYFTSLAIFFSNIAAIPEDVKILREAGIIQHQTADAETVLLLLQQLYRATEYSFNDCLIKNQVELIDKYVTSRRARFMGALRREVLANGIRFLVLFVTLFISLSFDTFRIKF